MFKTMKIDVGFDSPPDLMKIKVKGAELLGDFIKWQYQMPNGDILCKMYIKAEKAEEFMKFFNNDVVVAHEFVEEIDYPLPKDFKHFPLK